MEISLTTLFCLMGIQFSGHTLEIELEDMQTRADRS